MATEVELPQLGESVTEAVVTAWLVEVGDQVDVDQPIVEISTDKVDTEVPSPVAGTVTELRANVDDTIEPGQVIVVIDGDAASSDSGDQPDAAKPRSEAPPSSGAADRDAPAAPAPPPPPPPAASAPGTASVASGASASNGTPVLTSPLVRRMLREAGIDPQQVPASGPGGRITREDAEQAIASPPAPQTPAPASPAGVTPATPVGPPPVVQAPGERRRPPASPAQVDFHGEESVTQDLSRVRKIIARSMMESLQTTAQLTAAVEVDLTNIMNLRAATKDAFKAREGVSLSPLPLIARAVCMVMPRHPVMNSSIDTDSGTATFYRNINLGLAVDTERGLLVPNIKNAQELDVRGIARSISDLAARGRSKKLQPDEISGGTFTITNTGSVGTLFDTPILNPPEVGILATCAIEKRPVVVSDGYGDSIAIRWMSYLCLSYDHRMVDGADAARFLQDLRYVLETHDFSSELGV